MDLGWYCPSEGDGRWLGTRRPERAPDPEYLARVARAAERAGAAEILVPTGIVNDSFAPDAPFMESWTTATAVAALTRSIRIIVAINPAGLAPDAGRPSAETLERVAPGPGRRSTWSPAAGPRAATARRSSTTTRATPGCAPSPRWCAPASRARSTSAGASEAAQELAADVGRDLPDVGRAARADRRARRRDAGPRRTGPMRFGLRIHVIARADGARGPRGRPRAAVAGRGRAPTGRRSTPASTASARRA